MFAFHVPAGEFSRAHSAFTVPAYEYASICGLALPVGKDQHQRTYQIALALRPGE